MSFLLFVVSWSASMLAGIVVGVTVHEASHWVVMKAAGVPGVQLAKPSLSEQRLTASVTYDGGVSTAVRVAAVAPAITGALIIALLIHVQIWEMQPAVFAFFVGVAMWTSKLTRVDIKTARGTLVASE